MFMFGYKNNFTATYMQFDLVTISQFDFARIYNRKGLINNCTSKKAIHGV